MPFTAQVEVAAKLRMTAAALGCNTRKELCARFRSANPSTSCELARLHKWLQGRSLPRSGQFYEDWAKVLKSRRPGHWLASSSLGEFRAELAKLTGLTESDLPQPYSPQRRRAPKLNSSMVDGTPMLCGAFACYSHAWSPHYRGRLLRSALRIERGSRAGLIAVYTECLLGRSVRIPAEVQIRDQVLQLTGREPTCGSPLFFNFILPRPPVSGICGIMSGAALFAHHPLPSATRVLAVRVPGGPELDGSNRYMERGRPTIAADLRALGIQVSDPRGFEKFTATFLGEAFDQVSPSDQSAFARWFDLRHLIRTTELSGRCP